MKYKIETLQGLKWIVVSTHDTGDEAADALDAEVQLGSSAQMKVVRCSEAVIDESPSSIREILIELGGVERETTH